MSSQAATGRVPPHNEEAERAVLGALLIEPSRLVDVSDRLRAEDFFDPRHASIFESLVQLTDRNAPVDLVSVGEALQAAEKLQRVGGRSYLIELASCVSSAAHLAHHAGIVIETGTLRRLIREATEIVTAAYETRPDGESVPRLLDESETRIFGIAGERQSTHTEPISKAIHDAMRRIDMASHRGQLTGLASGYYDLDEMLCGFNGGEMTIIAARPSMGKTAFVLNLIERVGTVVPEWMEATPTVLFFSLEMGAQSIVSRMLCARARVDAHKLRTGRIPAEDYAQLNQAAGELHDTKIFIDDTPGLSVMAMRSRARRLKQRHGLHMVVVDYLQLMSHSKAESRQLEISYISRSLKELSRELDVPVIALSQLSRAVESRENKRPQLSDLRESGSIEQDADIVLLLYREEYYEPTEENRGLAEIICAKQRNGPTGTARLQFFGSTMRFENRAPSMAEPIIP